MNTWTPGPMYPPWWGPPNGGPSLQDVMLGQKFLDDVKKNLEEEEKKKKEKKPKREPPKFSFMETWGMIMLFSIPITLCQMFLIQLAQSKLAEIAATIAH